MEPLPVIEGRPFRRRWRACRAREIVRRVCAARAEIERPSRDYGAWQAVLGPDRTEALLRDERARWQRASGCCALVCDGASPAVPEGTLRVDISDSNEDDFIKKLTVRVEERVAFAAYKPTGFASVTGLVTP